MTRRQFVATAAATALLPRRGPLAAERAAAAAQPLNVVLILVDDWGWRDLGANGSDYYETPHLDRLASQGMRFTQAYAACPVCSPTRASLLTGRYPARLHLTDWIPGHDRPFGQLLPPRFQQQLPLAEVTLAEALAPAGYASAAIGKWHLGGPGFYPEQQGFSLNVGGTDRGQPPSYFAPYHIPTLPEGPDGEYLSDRLTTEAERFVTARRNSPFFLYLSHFAVHTPLQAKPAVRDHYRAKPAGNQARHNAVYAAMVQGVDDSVGRILARLERDGLADHTVVIVTGDNGGLSSSTSNLPLRSGKGALYEGGIREPLLVRWPGVTAAGSTCDEPVITPDLFATVLELAGVRQAQPTGVDGCSLVPLLRGAPSLGRDTIYWHYPHYHPAGESMGGAVRAGRWKLIEWYETGAAELYDLVDDPGEHRDLAAARPADASRLREHLAAWRRAVGADMPTPNPQADPARDTWPRRGAGAAAAGLVRD